MSSPGVEGTHSGTSPSDPAQAREMVRRGYDAVSLRYRDDDGHAGPDQAEDTTRYRGWIDELAALLPDGAAVLDLGCGAGVPATALLVERGFAVTGLDFSAVQIQRARALVPGATFVHADMASWTTETGSFDAVVSLYALIHLPVPDQRLLFPRLARWLVPGGYLLATVGHERWRGVEMYLGAPMFWDHADEATTLGWMGEAGLTPRWHRYVPEGSSGHTLVLAQAGVDGPPEAGRS